MTRLRHSPARAWIGAVCLWALAAPPAPAEPPSQGKIHLVIATDTHPKAALGEAVKQDGANVAAVFSDQVSPDRLTVKTLELAQITPAGITDALARLHVSAGSDTVVFYYSGHGAYDEQTGHYLDLPDRGLLRRETIRQTLLNHRPRLAVILTDCCYAYKPAPRRHDEAVGGVVSDEAPMVKLTPLFESLFFTPRGLVDITSSSVGEVSMTRGDENGSLFTYPLTQYLVNNAQRRLGWREVFETVRAQVEKEYKVLNPDGVKFPDGKGGTKHQTNQTPLAFKLAEPGSAPPGPVAAGTPKPPAGGPVFGARAQANNGDGVLVTQVVPGSPAERMGLEVNDVILSINGRPVASVRDYSEAIDQSPVVLQASVRNHRDGKVYEVKATLNKR